MCDSRRNVVHLEVDLVLHTLRAQDLLKDGFAGTLLSAEAGDGRTASGQRDMT